MESSYDLAYVISRGIVLVGCAVCAVLAARSPRIRPLAWLGVATMVAALLLGVLPTLGVGVPPTSGPDGHSHWHGWSALFFAAGTAVYLLAIAMGQRLREQPEDAA